jgi:hypothetical protein
VLRYFFPFASSALQDGVAGGLDDVDFIGHQAVISAAGLSLKRQAYWR